MYQNGTLNLDFQKQPPEVFCKKSCSYKFHKIHRKRPVPEPLFNKAVTKHLWTTVSVTLRRATKTIKLAKRDIKFAFNPLK